MPNPDQQRLEEVRTGQKPWQRWGPYLSERQWGTVREDYSENGDAWDFVTHDKARSYAYRWGEDGIGGFCDGKQHLCLALALWNGQDPILKERLFGLSNLQGNHGEDVKELYYYLDATPTYSYARMLYKYPQAAYPYERLVEENQRRSLQEREFEVLDTGVFNDDRYFDVAIEYAKADVEDILLRVTVDNRGPEPARIHVLPQVWYRNTWSWFKDVQKPSLEGQGKGRVIADHPTFGIYTIDFDGPHELLFCDNESNVRRLYGIEQDGYFKDAFHEYLVHGRTDAVNPERIGTKAGGLFVLDLPARSSAVVRVRLREGRQDGNAFADFDAVFTQRLAEAAQFYASLQSGIADEDMRRVQRQALAGMLWSKQFYYYDVREWLAGDPAEPKPPASRLHGRNSDWQHLNNADVISMPDKWEYPWYAAWDLDFHCISLALVDPEAAKNQLLLLGYEWYMHPNGQLPAYEWNFSDVNPPVHAWASLKVYHIDRQQRGGRGDLVFLERLFHKLMLNFTWWVNRKDAEGRNIFQGGFLGLDNIGVFDRSAPLPTGGHINQADGTAWMAMYALNLTCMALELALQGLHVYEYMATKLFEHFLYIAAAMDNLGDENIGLWNDEDNFYYDVLCMPDGHKLPLRLHTMVGLIPLYAVEVLKAENLEQLPGFKARLEWFLDYRPDLAQLVSRWQKPDGGDRRLLSLTRAFRMKRVLERMLDETEFLSPYGVRALSRYYREHPYVFEYAGNRYEVHYSPAESDSRLFGGNSNWRGPVWMPVNYLLIDSLRKFHEYYGNDFKVECPTGSGNLLSLREVAEELSRRLCRIFLRDKNGHRPVFNGYEKLQNDPHCKDHVLFHEYFDGDNGRGVGASHQTGWSGLVANLIHELHSGTA